MTYEEALAAIAALEPRGWKLGLERMAAFVERIGLGEAVTEPRYFHVAGTNGKGSTTSFIQSLLIAGGYRVGGFFSPFVFDPRERVQLNGELISKEDLAALTEELLAKAAKFDQTEYGGISEFEFKTALGFLYWHRHAADWIALETGLGGRLDSTNVVTPAVSVIVSIGLDHQAILGDTLEAIAFEKAGIIKPGRPVVLGKLPPPAREVILKVAEERESPVWEFGREIVLDGDTLSTPAGTMRRPEPQLVGVWQGHNAALAISALQLGGLHLDESTALAAVQNADIPGRFQRLTHLGKDVILDGAHNPDSADALARTLRQAYPGERFTLVTNMLAGHEVATFYASLKDLISEAIVVPIDFHRARPVSETVALLQGLGVTATGMDNQELGLRQAAEGQHRVLVTGSFYLVGEVGRLVGK